MNAHQRRVHRRARSRAILANFGLAMDWVAAGHHAATVFQSHGLDFDCARALAADYFATGGR